MQAKAFCARFYLIYLGINRILPIYVVTGSDLFLAASEIRQ